MSIKKRILVIGAGSSGLTSIKACKEEDLEVVCYEKRGYIGGLWHYHEDSVEGFSCVMKSTVTNTSKEMSAFSDFPPPAHFPAYLHNTAVVKYLQLYAEHFDLLSCIVCNQEVTKTIPADDYDSSGRWLVTVRDMNTDQSHDEVFDGVMICTGLHACPIIPSFPGLDIYTGNVLHSHQYKTSTGMENKVVLVVGAGNSGADIASEVSLCASKVFLSIRRGTWIFPRMVNKGKPFDVFLIRRINSIFPSSVSAAKLEKLLDSRMDHSLFGIKPHHRAVSQTPTITEDLPIKILTGMVAIKKNINRFTGCGVVFEGESEETAIDVVVFATGYEIKFPFLSEDILKVNQNKVSLYKHMFPPLLQHPTLAIIGLLQPNASSFPMFEMQARWFALLITGKVRFPNREELLRDIRTVEKFRAANYVESPRHTVGTNWLDYMDALASIIGVKPKLSTLFCHDPKLFWACVKGPCLPYQYRINGPHCWDGARDAIFTYKDRLYKHLSTLSQDTSQSNMQK